MPTPMPTAAPTPSGPATPTGVTAVVVVIPARDEAQALLGCLAALATALAHPAAAALRRDVVVVLDRCRDASAAVVAAAGAGGVMGANGPGLRSVVCDAGSVGAARRLGVADALAHVAPDGCTLDPARTWIACTDADSTVPADWIAVHLRLAAAGADLVRGTVVLDPRTPAARSALVERPSEGDRIAGAWEAAYQRVEGHPHVHGANLGVRASAYLAAGGFPAVRLHEDALLARAVQRQGGRVVATALAPVATSARRRGRTPGGVAADLRRLARGLTPSA